MSNENGSRNEEYSNKTAAAYGMAFFADITAVQMIGFLLFTFYFAVVGLDVFYITIVM